MNKEVEEAIVLNIEVDTYEQEMFFTEEMSKNIGKIVVIDKPVKYLDDFYTIKGDDNYNAYHISWLYFINTQPNIPTADEIVKELKNAFTVSGSKGYTSITYTNGTFIIIENSMFTFNPKTIKISANKRKFLGKLSLKLAHKITTFFMNKEAQNET